jgi:hypothetical protein
MSVRARSRVGTSSAGEQHLAAIFGAPASRRTSCSGGGRLTP